MAVATRPLSLGLGSYNGITWGPGQWLQVISHDGLEESPSVRTQDTDRAEGHGSWSGPDWLGPRTVTLTFALIGLNNTDLRQRLTTLEQAFVLDGVDRTLWLFDSQRYLNARVRRRRFDPALGGRGNYATVTIVFYAPYPLYRGIPQTAAVALARASGGITFPLDWPMTFGTVVGGTVINNAGNMEAPVVITVPGPATNPAISNDQYNASIIVNIVLGTGDLLTIDTDLRTVQLGGQSRDSLLAPQSSWWNLLPGSNLVRYSSGSAGPSEGASVIYAPVWG